MTTHHLVTPDEQIESRVRGEFLEMPGLCLSFGQAQRLWTLDAGTCTRILGTLVARGFLSCDAMGRYARATAHRPATSARMAKADIPRAEKLKSH